VVLAGILGALAGLAGAIASHLAGRGVPTGPTIVLAATILVLLSMAFGSARGMIWRR
jgi:manganese/zinc/iron transport system permease protein